MESGEEGLLRGQLEADSVEDQESYQAWEKCLPDLSLGLETD